MDSINVVNLKTEKANANKRLKRLRTITALFRLIELLFFFIILSRISIQFPVSLSFAGDHLRELYSAVFSPRTVFVIGNAIVVILFLKSSRNSNSDQLSADVYTEYVEKRENEGRERKVVMERSKSGDLERVKVPRKQQLRRSSTDLCRGSIPAEAPLPEEMSGEEFRRRVEDFIARQQRSLREDEFSPIVTY